MNLFRIVKPFIKLYSTGKFLSFFSTAGHRLNFIKEALVLFFCLRDPRTPRFVRLLLVGVLGYLITPVDLIPDALLGLGWLDDIAVITAAMKVTNKYILPEHVLAARKFVPFSK